MPVIGFLSSATAEGFAPFVTAAKKGLSEAGYSEGRNLAIEYRWARGQYDRLPAMAADLVQHRVAAIIATGSTAPALAAKASTDSIPIVFVSGGDPVKAGLISSLNRPGGNVTGVSMIYSALVQKRLELLFKLAPKTVNIGVLVNPNYPEADLQRRELQEAAEAIKQQTIHVVSATSEREIDAAFETLVRQGTDALLVANDPYFDSRRDQIAALAARHTIPAIYSGREYTAAGGLMSYGASITDSFHQAGVYTARILKGEKPSDLPVLQPTKFELVINLKVARTLGLDVPPALLAIVDDVIE
jgi:putative ABC transport system substrate-binding protein